MLEPLEVLVKSLYARETRSPGKLLLGASAQCTRLLGKTTARLGRYGTTASSPPPERKWSEPGQG